MSISFNIEESEKRRKEEIKNAQELQNRTLTTVPTVHSDAKFPNDVISDMFIDNYHRALIKGQRECQKVLHDSFNQITESGKFAIGGFSEFVTWIPDKFLVQLAEEYYRGQQFILAGFSKNDEFAISIVEMFGEKAKKQGGQFEFTNSSGWEDYRKWQPPPTSSTTTLTNNICYDKERCQTDSVALLDKMFNGSYLFDKVKTQTVIHVPDMDPDQVTRNAISGLWGLIEDLKKSMAV